MICQSCDDKGNAIVYEYVAENDDNVDLSHINERNRARSANRYLKYIRYGNRQPLLIDPAQPSFRQTHVPAPDFSSAGWMFEVVFDYGEGHTMTLDVDDYGNVRQSVAIAYGRRFDDTDPVLTDADGKKQKQLFVISTEASFTNAVLAVDAYRTPLPAEAQTYELLKLRPASQQSDITNLFRFDELVTLVAQAGDGAHDLPYEDINAARAAGAGVYRRPIEDLRTRYRSNDLSQSLPLWTLQALALPGERYKLAFTPELLSTVYQRPHIGLATENLLPNPGTVLPADTTHESDRGGYVDLDGDGRWWFPSGRLFFHPTETATAADELVETTGHFFLPRRFRDPFAHNSFVDYANDLFPAKTRDALGNTVGLEAEGRRHYRDRRFRPVD